VADTTWQIFAAAEDGVDGYSTVAAWEAATDGVADLVTAQVRHIGEMQNENFAESDIDIDGCTTTNASYYRWLRAASGHEFNHVTALAAGVDPGARMVVTGSAAAKILDVEEDYARVGGSEGASSGSIGFKLQTSSAANIVMASPPATTGIECHQCVVFESSCSGAGQFRGFYVPGGEFYNCLAVDLVHTGAGQDVQGFNLTSATAYNCVAYGIDATAADDARGFESGTAYNCYAGGVTAGDTAFAFGTLNTDDYCAADDTTPDGANSHDSIAATDCFVSVTGGSEDFHLKSGSSLIDEGTTTGTNGYDIDGSVAGDRLDIGIHEYEAPGGLDIPIAMHHYKQLMGAN
jgi:hypothetical protein